MARRISYILRLLIMTMLAPVSCMREPFVPEAPEREGERVPVTLSLDVASLEAGTVETKTVMEPDNSVSSDDQIANFVILQFKGVTDEALIAGTPQYVDHWPLVTDPSDPDYDVISLSESSTPNAVVVVANTFRPILSTGPETTLGDFMKQYTSIAGLSDVLTSSGGNDYFRMNGAIYLSSIFPGAPVNVSLKRSVAKIVINVTNSTSGNSGDDRITLSHVQLKGINTKSYYLTNFISPLSLEFSDPYTEAVPPMDNALQVFDGAGNSGTTQTYSYYVPANLRGTNSSQYQYNKGTGAPEGATRFSLYGTYGDSNTPIVYTYYLGEDLVNDFNIQPNHKYTYNIEITGKGNSHYDSRVKDLAEVKFETDANCYMLQPPSVAGQYRIYSFPVRRAAVFWNERGNNLGLYEACKTAGYEDYVLDASTEWTAEILWSDFNMTTYPEFLHVASGTGFDPTDPSHTQPYITVKVRGGMNGNVVVAMKSVINEESVILWSWHLWITDYDPDQVVVPASGKYIYSVPGGEIHRYNNPLFSTNPTSTNIGLANGFVMDRNVGALGVPFSMTQSCGLYYQYGRKDPFIDVNQNGSKRVYYNAGTSSTSLVYRVGHSVENVCYGVTHPKVMVSTSGSGAINYSWAFKEPLIGGEVPSNWYDPLFSNHLGNPAVAEIKKSFYDPCPPGWKIPPASLWSGFNVKNASNESARTYTTLFMDNGRYYYPEGYCKEESTGSIFYPANGYMHSSGPSLESRGGQGNVTSLSAASVNFNGGLTFTSSSLGSLWGQPVHGYNIRCVRE